MTPRSDERRKHRARVVCLSLPLKVYWQLIACDCAKPPSQHVREAVAQYIERQRRSNNVTSPYLMEINGVPVRCATAEAAITLIKKQDGRCPDTRVVQRLAEWPEGVSDGLTLPCSDCGQHTQFDYHVTDEFWRKHVPEKPARLSVVCLPCLDKRCNGEGLADALIEIQWTGRGHTVVCQPVQRYVYIERQRKEQA